MMILRTAGVDVDRARSCRGIGASRTVLRFPRYLQRVRGLARLRELPVALGHDLLARGGHAPHRTP